MKIIYPIFGFILFVTLASCTKKSETIDVPVNKGGTIDTTDSTSDIVTVVPVIEGTWNVVSCTNDEGTIKYGYGNHVNVRIRFTLNIDGTYTWITDNTSSATSLPIIIKGTYIYTATNSKLKITGKGAAGNYMFDDNHLYNIEKLTASQLIISEVTEIYGVGKQTYELSR